MTEPTFPAAVEPTSIEPPAHEPQPQEPALSMGVLVTFAGAVITCLIVFGVPVTPEQKLAILGVLIAAAPIVTAVLTRRRVFSPETVRLLLASHYERGRTAGRKEITG